MFKHAQLKHQREKNELNQKTAEVLGHEFVLTYSLDNAEAQDLFYEMFQLNFNQS